MDETTKMLPLEERTFSTHDEFHRKPVAEKVIKLLTSDIDVSPMVIDGGWGAGKTEFCHKLIKLFQEKCSNFRCIYVDAFKADHADEPLITLLAAVAAELPKSKQKQLIEKAIPAVRFALKTSLKAGVGWVMRQNADKIADDFEKDVEQAGKAAVDASIESLLKDHIAAKESIQSLREALERLAKQRPIVIFVDELDRCRPDFAVSMLENIKHIFDVEGVDFVLVTNSSQLRAAIKHQYGGDDTGAQRYLDKFIAFTFELPRHVRHTGDAGALAAHFHFWARVEESLVLREDSGIQSRLTHDFTTELIYQNDITLRQVETWVRHLEIYQLLAHGSEFDPDFEPGRPALAIFAIYVFAFHKDLVHDIKRDSLDPAKMSKLLGRDRLVRSNSPNDGNFLYDLVGLFALTTYPHPGPFGIEDGKEAEYWRVRAIKRFGESFKDTKRQTFKFFQKIFDAFEFGVER